jgi:hypothetical protein
MKRLVCVYCEDRFIERRVILPYKTVDFDNNNMIILDVPHYVCYNCGHTRFGVEALKMIEDCQNQIAVHRYP